jgi:hypothetical protein
MKSGKNRPDGSSINLPVFMLGFHKWQRYATKFHNRQNYGANRSLLGKELQGNSLNKRQ